MHGLRGFFDKVARKAGLADEVIALSPRRHAAEKPFQLGDVQEQNEIYLDLGTGADFIKGGLTGTLAMGTFYSILLLFPLLFMESKQIDAFVLTVGVVLGLTIVSFLIEVFLPFPLPVRFNRRTREVYFQDKNKLYHVPWDEAVAWLQQTRQVTQYTGATRMTFLQLALQRFRRPEEVIALQLSLPMGKTPEIQAMLWEYLRCYMEKGPWFDERGEPLAASNRDEVLAMRRGKKANLRGAWRDYQDGMRKGVDSRSSVAVMMAVLILFQPAALVQDWTTAVARRRARKQQWDMRVLERSRPDGPTTRLYDLEVAEGLHEATEVQTAPTEDTA